MSTMAIYVIHMCKTNYKIQILDIYMNIKDSAGAQKGI